MSLYDRLQVLINRAQLTPHYREMWDQLERVLAAGSRILVAPIGYTDATGNPDDVSGVDAAFPAGSLIVRAHVVPTTLWDALTSFTSGFTGTVDAFVTNTEHDLTGGLGGLVNEARTVEIGLYLATAKTVLHTWTQGAAAQGAGYIFYEYIPRSQAEAS